MAELLWTAVGEDTGAEVLAIDEKGAIFVGYLRRSMYGDWIAYGPNWQVSGVRAYIPVSRLVEAESTGLILTVPRKREVSPRQGKGYHWKQAINIHHDDVEESW